MKTLRARARLDTRRDRQGLAMIAVLLVLVALFVLGVGWNFLYIGGTTLFTQTYQPEEKTMAQAAMDTIVYTTMTLTSFSSGALITTQGWTWLNLGSMVPVAITGLALAWLAMQQRRPENQALR